MFYPNNNSYMEDLYFYNQMPSNPYINNPGTNFMGNQISPSLTNGNNMNAINPFMGFTNTNMPVQNLNNLYPSIYRIVNPVVSKVVLNSSNQIINDEMLNNMVDTVFNIVEGQVDLDAETQVTKTLQNENQTSQNQSPNTSSGLNSNTRTNDINRQTNQNNNRNTRCDNLLKDLIKILIIKEILLKNYLKMVNVQTQGMQGMYNPFFNSVNF